MAVVAWLTVIVGTFVVYPWYRASPSAGVNTSQQSAELEKYLRSYLLASKDTQDWHKFGMEWKEHVAWLAPMLATVVAYAVLRYGKDLINHQEARRMIMTLFVLSFAIAGIAGLLGALITKAAPLK